ncbi:protein-disulfide reductase DsbD [bacterium]|nr:protein-disulfide reductase DsbD [bacterium]
MNNLEKHKSKALIIIIAFLLFMPAGSKTQGFFTTPQTLVTTEGHLSQSAFHIGSSGYIAITADITNGWHINSPSPPDAYLIPTRLKVTMPNGITVVNTLYPEAEEKMLEISDSPLPLYEGKVTFGIIFKVSEDINPGNYKIAATLNYQGCNNMTCLQPADSRVEIKLNVVEQKEKVEEINKNIFSAAPFLNKNGEPVIKDMGGISDNSSEGKNQGEIGIATQKQKENKESVSEMIEKRGILLSLLIIFLGGLALNLTPCIYPLIPITISFFGGQAEGKGSKALGLSLLYVLGISITYSALGVIAATTGGILGAALQNPWVIFFIALILLGLAASMFGLWEIRMPMFVMKRTGSAKKGTLGALLMGLTVGIVAAPCIGPFVLGLLTYVGKIGNPILGFIMFFTLAWGMGIPFIILGTVSGSISRLPRSGVWLEWVKQIFGFIIILMAFYFTRYLLGTKITYTGYALTALSASIYLGWIIKTPGSEKGFKIIKKVVSFIWLIAAIILITRPGGPIIETQEGSHIQWVTYTEAEFDKAKLSGKPIMMDFTADWCIPCHELDHKTFSNPEVMNLARDLITIKVELTNSNANSEKIKKEFNIKGVPTILFFDSKGNQISKLRISGFIKPERLIEKIKKLE